MGLRPECEAPPRLTFVATDLLLGVLLGVGGEGAEQPVGFVIDAGGEVQRVRRDIERPGWEAQAPQPSDGERVAVGVPKLATELAARGFVGIDLPTAEVADQDVAAKSAEGGWGQRHCPRRVELAAA